MAKRQQVTQSLTQALQQKRWDTAVAQAVLTAAEQSGAGLPVFAKRYGVDVQRLQYWQRRLLADERIAFREVTLHGSDVPQPKTAALAHETAQQFEVVLRNGTVVRTGAGFDAEAMRRLVAVLEARC